MSGLFDKFKASDASKVTTELGEVAQRFALGGCESINNTADKQSLQTFAQLPSTIQIKVPGSGQLNTAIGTCKPEM